MNLNLIMLIISTLIAILLFFYLKKNNSKNLLTDIFKINLILILVWNISLIAQILFSNKFNIDPLFFDCFAYIGICFLPVSIFFTGLIFTNTKIKFKKSYLLFFIVPLVSLILLWTNSSHLLFYKVYSIDINKIVFGPYFSIHTIYTYLMYAIGLILLLKYSIKNSGFFSNQALLFIGAALIPIGLNVLATTGIINTNIYVTPISFTITILLMAFAIFKFKFLSVTPIAMQRIVDRMSDSFLVVNENGIITDFNDTFLKTFKLSATHVRNANFIQFLNSIKLDDLANDFKNTIIDKCKTTEETILVKREIKIKDNYFNIEASGIFSNNSFIGTLILLKDVSQHVIDRNIIEDNQSMLMEKERLASLGQMIGGIAHNLKTPIMSIAGAAEGLSDLIKEYDISIGDPSVTNEDHHEIVKDMNSWIEKVKTHTAYMSDVITAVKGQAVTFTETKNDSFTISELLTHIDVLMKHELKNALIELNTSVLVPTSLSINGNINSLVQVINNIISNAIQAYSGKTNKNIDFIIKIKDNNLIFVIQDYGCGMPKKVQDKLFKEMITTKGKNGTGLGLFMSYSNIRAHFNGNMSFESTEGKGTRFDITIPLN